jgi:hypothetical protein
MSLDIYLSTPTPTVKIGTGVFVRDGGSNRELSVAEVKERWPESDVVESEFQTEEVYSANITHNLGEMASAAELYYPLWRPEEINITKAKQLIVPLAKGLESLIEKPDYYKTFNPENGWGSYDGLLNLVENYLKACIDNPDADVSVSR